MFIINHELRVINIRVKTNGNFSTVILPRSHLDIFQFSHNHLDLGIVAFMYKIFGNVLCALITLELFNFHAIFFLLGE